MLDGGPGLCTHTAASCQNARWHRDVCQLQCGLNRGEQANAVASHRGTQQLRMVLPAGKGPHHSACRDKVEKLDACICKGK